MAKTQAKLPQGKAYIWFSLGSIANALSSFILLMVVTRTLGSVAGGIFSIAFALSYQFSILGHFEMRPLQATDIEEKYSFGTYLGSRIVTCLLMMVCIVAFALYTNGFTSDSLVIILISSMKFFDSFEDVFHGLYQQKDRVDLSGKSFFFRIVISTLCFCLLVVLSRDLVISASITCLASLIAMLAINVPLTHKFTSLKPSFEIKPLVGLLLSSLPLFIGAFLFGGIVNAPRFGIELWLTKEDQVFFACLFMPTMVINLLSGFIFKPLLTSLSQHWAQRSYRQFASLIIKSTGIVTGGTVLAFLIAFPFGTTILSWIYGINLTPYTPELLVLLFGGFLSALSMILSYIIITMRKQGLIIIAYIVSGLSCILAAYPCITVFGLMGAALLYNISLCTLCVSFIVIIFFSIAQGLKKDKSSGLTISEQ